jgi:choline dehydrogenase-like flavoprotein
MSSHYDLIVVGTGFGSSFFLKKYLQKARHNVRVLVLERGIVDDHGWQVQNRKNSSVNSNATFINQNPGKRWIHTVGFGGGSNCWWACTPRFHPEDFELKSRYGVSHDWPISYNQLEPYYVEAEQAMNMSGPSDHSPYPRSAPYPTPAHRLSSVDQLLQQAYPQDYFVQPTARSSVYTSTRPKCCGNGVCHICPINAKFTIQNEMMSVYNDPRVSLQLQSQVEHLQHQGGNVQAVVYRDLSRVDSAKIQVRADLVVLGANALFNPFILLTSEIEQPMLGANLNEQEAMYAVVDLNGLDNYDGSTSITGHNYAFYTGPHRKQRAACLVESWNTLESLRLEQGKWRQRVVFKAVFEALPNPDNRVVVSEQDSALPETVYQGPSHYVEKSIDHFKRSFPDWLSVLPVEAIEFKPNLNNTEAHIQGTTMMGLNPDTSVVDQNLVHHQLRNLVVVGSGAFPTCPPANPSLTISALSLMAADKIVG